MGTMNRRLNQAGLSAYNLYKMIWQIFKYALWTSAITLYFPTKITCVPSFKLRRNWCWRRDWKQRKCGAVRCVKLVASAIAAQCWNLYQLSLFFFGWSELVNLMIESLLACSRQFAFMFSCCAMIRGSRQRWIFGSLQLFGRRFSRERTEREMERRKMPKVSVLVLLVISCDALKDLFG